MEIAKWLKGGTTQFLVLHFDSPAAKGQWLLAAFSCLALCGKKQKTKGLQSYGCHLVFVSFSFLLDVFQSVSELWCPIKSCCIMHNALSPKKKTKLFFSLKHYMSYLNSSGDAGLGFYWTTEHTGSLKTLSLGRAVCELRTVFFLLSNVNILVFEFLNHFNIIRVFTLYFYKHIHTQL